MSVFFPLDTARLRLQADEKTKTKTTHAMLLEIIKEEGLLAPYRGWFPVISSLCCSVSTLLIASKQYGSKVNVLLQ